jgi:hypothetical protein
LKANRSFYTTINKEGDQYKGNCDLNERLHVSFPPILV